MLKILVGVGFGFLLFSSPDARQITADMLRSAADYLDPAGKDGTQGIELKIPPIPLPKN